MNNVLTAFATILVIAVTACGAPPPKRASGRSGDPGFRNPARARRRPPGSVHPGVCQRADIPIENTQYKDNVFPGLAWSAGPAATQSYVIILET
jgi:hypothetical protein